MYNKKMETRIKFWNIDTFKVCSYVFAAFSLFQPRSALLQIFRNLKEFSNSWISEDIPIIKV